MTEREERLAALKGRGPEEILRALLEIWRVQPAEELADAIACLTDTHRESLPNASFASLAGHASPALLRGVLLATIDPRSHKKALTQLEEIARWPRDPRITDALLLLIERHPWRSGPSATSWHAAFHLLAAQRDPRVTLPDPDEWAMNFPTDRAMRDMSQSMRELLRAQEEVDPAPTLSAPEREALGALIPKRTVSDAHELIQAIYADVTDDGSRAVYADLLSSSADAAERERGEFITLQLEKGAYRQSKGQQARESALFKANKMRWLGELGDVMLASGLTYERGFPVTGALAGGTSADAIVRVTGDARWRTFRSLDVRGNRPGYYAFLSDPVFYGLRELTCVAPGALGGFDRYADRALERIAIASQLKNIGDRVLGSKGFPRLTTFALTAFAGDRPDALEAFTRSALGQQVSRFEIEHSEESRDTYGLWCPALMKTAYASFLVTAPRGSRNAASFTYEGVRDGEKWKLSATYVKKKKHEDHFDEVIESIEKVRSRLSAFTLKTPRYKPSTESMAALKKALGDVPLTLK